MRWGVKVKGTGCGLRIGHGYEVLRNKVKDLSPFHLVEVMAIARASGLRERSSRAVGDDRSSASSQTWVL